MRIGIIGIGAIGKFVHQHALHGNHQVLAFLLRPERLHADGDSQLGVQCVSAAADFPEGIDHVVDCAGHAALREHGAAILRRGIDLTTVSLGALADPELHAALQRAAETGGSRLHLASGAIGALDCLRAARISEISRVKYTGRKPPLGWRGSPAENHLDLDGLSSGCVTHFAGSARDAAIEYPKNANVAAAVALAGVGFDETRVELIADADVTENIHEVTAAGAFGSFTFEVRGRSLPDNPRSSALAAMSVISKLQDESDAVAF